MIPIWKIRKLKDPELVKQGHLTKGYQTSGNFFAQKTPMVEKISTILHLEIEKYRNLFSYSDEGFLKKWPEKFSLSGWLISMESGGELSPHIHEPGWVSGVVYINVPPKTQTDSGNLVVCIDEQKLDPNAVNKNGKSIDVVTGALVFFPASLMHYTIPFESKERRIVLAFDILPE